MGRSILVLLHPTPIYCFLLTCFDDYSTGTYHSLKITSRKTVSEVIDRLDEDLGLEMPIFVFAFSKMRRCISYRSEKRVPTHMVLSLGDFQSNEAYIQALGRATFNGLETVLKANGFPHVTILTTKNDLAMAQLVSTQ